MTKLVLIFLVSTSFVIVPAFAQELHTLQRYVAKVGNAYISEREFVSRFEMLPGIGRHQKRNLESKKAEFLYTLIAEKLLAQAAVERSLDSSKIVQHALETIRKKLARDELYRAEIIRKVEVSDVGLSKESRERRN